MKEMDGWMVGGWMNEQVDRQLNEAMDGWIHRWTDRWIKAKVRKRSGRSRS